MQQQGMGMSSARTSMVYVLPELLRIYTGERGRVVVSGGHQKLVWVCAWA